MQSLCIYKKHSLAAIYIILLLFIYILYSLSIVFIYKKHAKTVLVSQLYRFCIVCTLFVFAKNIHFKFQALSVCTLKYISSAFIITPNVDLYNLCIQNICKFSALYDFSIHFLWLCKFFSIGPLCNSSYIHSERNRECPFCVPGHK